MQIKVFKASSMKEAVAKMKDELGDDAVILHTKKYKEGGLLGLGSKEMVEITAAIEDEKPAPKNEPELPQRSTPIMPTSVLEQYKTNGTPEGVAMAERELNLTSREIDNSSINQDNSKLNDSTPNNSTFGNSTSQNSMSEEDKSLMSPNLNQASSLEESMKSNSKPSRPDPPMPYDDDEPSTIPYELEISSKSELNDQQAKESVISDEQVDDKKFVQSNAELDESAVENEPDENVYMAEPAVNATNINSDVQVVQSSANVPPYNDSGVTVANSSVAQINGMQSETDVSVAISPQSQPQIQQPIQNQTNLQPQPQPQQPVQNPQPQPQPQQQSQQMTDDKVFSSTHNDKNQTQPQQLQQPQQQSPQQSPQQPVQNPQPQSQSQPAINSPEQTATNQQQQSSQQQPDVNQPLTPAQLAQAQAMMMAQFNQMQMAQVMQQAVAQAQAQAQEQVRQAYLQAQAESQHTQAIHAQEVHSQSIIRESPQRSTPSNVPQTDDHESQVKIKKLENEIAQMKALLAQVIGKETNRGLSLHEALRRQEVNENILNDMAAHSEAGETLADSQSREAKSTLVKFLKENINFSEGIKLNRHGVRIVALLGTTGVGKTTTLAKIAAKFVLEQGITAALITADTYRISAVEQLRTYSDILGLPLEIVYSPAELSKAINKYRNRDLILIDTAGRSQHNDYQMKELQDFLASNQRIEKHLVLSATTKGSDADDIIEKFAVCEPDKVIFTKTDETASVGLILNLLFKQKLSISYFTNGQSVPDDITPANAEVLAGLLLRKEV